MSEQQSARERAEEDLTVVHNIADVARLQAEIDRLNAAHKQQLTRLLEPLEAAHRAELGPLEAKLAAAVQAVTEVVTRRAAESKSGALAQTFKFPSGTVSLSTSLSTVVKDEGKLLAWARSSHVVTRIFTRKSWVVNLTMLKAFVKAFPQHFSKIADLLEQTRTTTITIAANSGIEVKQETDSKKVPYPAPEPRVEPRTQRS